MFQQLDNVMLLARGHMVYSGPPSMVSSYLAAAGAPCPTNRPIAEHMLHAVSEAGTLAALLSAGSCEPGAYSMLGGRPSTSSDAASTSSGGSSVRADAGLSRDQQQQQQPQIQQQQQQPQQQQGASPAGPVAEGTLQDVSLSDPADSAGGEADGAPLRDARRGAGCSSSSLSASTPDAEVRLVVGDERLVATAPLKKGVRYACMAQVGAGPGGQLVCVPTPALARPWGPDTGPQRHPLQASPDPPAGSTP
jgi:hypothetical protein